MTAFTYVPLDERPGYKHEVERRSVRQRIKMDLKDTSSFAAAITEEDRQRNGNIGINLGEDRLTAE